MTEPTTEQADQAPVRDAESVARMFPDAGPAPSNVVVVDPDAPPSPNIAHPH